MKIEKIHNNFRYTLSNDNLKNGDKVYPIADGRCLEDGEFILHNFNYHDLLMEFDDPHTILDLQHSNYKPYEVSTDKGYSPKEVYYKIIKIEKQIKEGEGLSSTTKWIEI